MTTSELTYLEKMSPIRIELEITEACNLRCRFCYNSCNPVVMPLDRARTIIDRLHDEGVLELVLTGGEPLLNPNFDKILDYACKIIPRVLLQTNGTLLTTQIVENLQANLVSGINISIHGCKDDHEYLTQLVGSYNSAIRALQYVIETKIPLWVNTVLTRSNIDNLELHLEELYHIGVRNFTFTRFTPVGLGASADLALEDKKFLEILYQIDTFIKNHNSSALLANAVPYCFLPDDLKHFAEICSFGLTKFYVDVYGNLLYCGMTRASMGNILSETISDIKSQSPVFIQNCQNKLCPQACQICPYFNIRCRGGCRAAALAKGSLSGSDPLIKEFIK